MISLLHSISMIFLALYFISCFFLIILYTLNKKKYKTLMDMYFSDNHRLYNPYLFNYHTGFFGSFNIAYYFTRLSRNKTPILMQNKNDVSGIYLFCEKVDRNLLDWMVIYYRSSVFSVCLLFICFLFAVLTNVLN